MSSMTAEQIRIGELSIRFLLEGDESNGSAALFEFTVPARAKVPVAHSHDAYEETVYGLEGTLTWTVDGERRDVGPGEAFCIRRGTVHRFENEGKADARVLAVVTPGVLGPDYFRDLAALVDEAVASGSPPDPARIGEVMLRHGLTPAP
jgi:quercetin dioxygenase-like cupin family protein